MRSLREVSKLRRIKQNTRLPATANRWIFVTPARMFLLPLSLSRILSAVMLRDGISYLLTYNKSLDASRGSVFRIKLD